MTHLQGSHIMRYMAQNYPQNIKLALFNMFFHLPGGVASYVPWLEWLPLPRTITGYIGEKLTEYGHSEAELRAWKRHEDIAANGVGYSAIQRSRVRLSFDILLLPSLNGISQPSSPLPSAMQLAHPRYHYSPMLARRCSRGLTPNTST